MTQPTPETVERTEQRTRDEYTAIDIWADMGWFPSAGSVPYDVAARAIVSALAAMPSLDAAAMRWEPIETAPYSTIVEVRAGHMTFRASLEPGVSENDAGQSVDQWQAAIEGEHPPCWSDGACWETNMDETTSLQPAAWRALPLAPGETL